MDEVPGLRKRSKKVSDYPTPPYQPGGCALGLTGRLIAIKGTEFVNGFTTELLWYSPIIAAFRKPQFEKQEIAAKSTHSILNLIALHHLFFLDSVTYQAPF